MSTFSIRLQKLLNEKDMTQGELARRTGITQSSISDYINDRYSPKQDKIDLIAKALNCSPSYLLGIDSASGTSFFDVSCKTRRVVVAMNNLNETGQTLVADYAELLDSSGNYRRTDGAALQAPETQYTYIDTKYAAAAGRGYINDEYAYATRHKVKVQDAPNYDEAIEVHGDSMSPLIADGDIAYVQYEYEYQDGKIYAVQVFVNSL